jgi:hypothetical protein
MFKVLNPICSTTQQSLAAVIVCTYAAVVLLSMVRHSQSSNCHHISLRAVSLLREAAQCSVRAEDPSSSAVDHFIDSTQAKIYVDAVYKVLSPAQVSKFGISVDDLRSHTERQMDGAFHKLHASARGRHAPVVTMAPEPSFRY